jgi:hypothetical protein
MTNPYLMGDLVKYELAQHGSWPRWNVGCDGGSTGTYTYGKIISDDGDGFTIVALAPDKDYKWEFKFFDKDNPGFPKVVKKLPKGYFGKPAPPDSPKDLFYVEVDYDIIVDGATVKKNVVSKAARPWEDDHATVFLLDLSYDGKMNLRTSPQASWLEVSKISRSKYYRKRKEQSGKSQ